MKTTRNSLRLLPLLAVAVLNFQSVTAQSIWNATNNSVVNTNWSTAANWTPSGVPGANTNVVFNDRAAETVVGTVNNVVDTSRTIASLTYSQTNGTHTTLIPGGVTLTISNSTAANSLLVGTETDVSATQQETDSITGAGGTLVLLNTNTGSALVIRQASATSGSHRATLDMSGLDNFNATIGRVLNAVQGGTVRPAGTWLLARTNLIICNGATAPQIALGDGTSNGGNAITQLGQTNAIFADNITQSRQKSAGTLSFNPAFSNPVAYIRGLNRTNRVTLLAVGDNSAQSTSTTSTSGTIDLSGGIVDATVDTIYVGRGMSSSGTGSATGTLTIGAGTLDANTIEVGYQNAANAAATVTGSLNVNGTATLVANTSLRLARYTGSGTVSVGNLNVNGGTVKLFGDLVDGGGTTTVNVNSGTVDLLPPGDTTAGNLTVKTLSLGSTGAAMITNAASITASNSFTVGAGGIIAGATTINVLSGVTMDVSALSGGFTLGGTQTLQGAGTVNGNFTQASGAAITPGSSAGTLTFNNDLTLNAGKLNFELSNDPSQVGGANDLISVGGNLVLNGTNDVSLTALNGDFGTATPYRLINYNGTLTGDANYFRLVGPLTQSRRTFAFDTGTANQVNLTVGGSAAATLTWVGDGSANVWNINGAANWTDGSSQKFFNLDAVTFDDTGSDSPSVSLTGTLVPGSITVSNETKNFTFSGSGGISGGTSLTKLGAATLTIAGTGTHTFSGPVNINGGTLAYNRSDDLTVASVITGAGTLAKRGGNILTLSGASTYSGATSVENGTLRPANNTALGAIPGGNVTISTGATLDVGGNTTANNASFGAKVFNVAGAGVGGNGAIVNNGAVVQQNVFSNITLTANATFGGASRWDIRSGTALGASLSTGNNGYNLTKVGTNEIWIVNCNVDAALADVTVQSGVLGYQDGTSGLGNSANTLTIASGATLGFFNATNVLNKVIVLNGGGTNLDARSGATTALNTVSGATTLNGNCLINVNGSTVNLTLSNAISGGGSFTKTGAGTNFLSGTSANSYGGPTTNSAGTLVLAKSGANAIPGSLAIPGGTVSLAASDQIADGAPITVLGGTLAIGVNSDTVGAVVLDNNGTISGAGGALTGSNYEGRSGTISANLAGPAVVFTKTTTNGVILTGTNSYGGGTVVSLGSLRATTSPYAFGTGPIAVANGGQVYHNVGAIITNDLSIAGTGVVEASGNFGALRVAANGSVWSGTVTLIGNSRISSRLATGTGGAIAGRITGGYDLELNYTGDSNGNLILSNPNNDWSGNTWIEHGTLRLGATEVLPNGAGKGNVTLSNSWPTTATILDLNGFSETVNGLASAGADLTLCVITNSSATGATLAAGDNNATSTFGGFIKAGTGAIGLTKVGSGTLTLTAANTYTGGTTVSNGTLRVDGSLAAASAVTVYGGALGGNGTINGSVSVQTGGTLAPGASIGRLTVNNLVLLSGTALMELDKASATNDVLQSSSTIIYGGTLKVTNLGGTLAANDSFKLFNAASYSGSFANFDLPALGGGLSWDTTGLTNGTIKVIGGGVAQPHIDSLTLSGANVALTGSGGPPSGSYSVRASTNVGQAISNWSVLATGQAFDGSGNFNYTNIGGANLPLRFYVLQVP